MTDTDAVRPSLEELLDEIIHHPERRAELEARIEASFTEEAAVFVLDMSGFSRTTQTHGIVSFLLMIHQMRLLALPVVEAHKGVLVKAEADNIYCVFGQVKDAVAAAVDIMRRLDTVNPLLPQSRRLYASIGIGFGRVLLLDHGDMFGDEMNLASKLGEDVAAEGEVLLTESAWTQAGEVAASEERVSISGLVLTYYKLS